MNASDAPNPLADVPDEAWPVLEHLARGLHLKNAQLQPTLDAIVSQAVDVVGPAEHAGLILILAGRLVPQATQGEPPRQLDELQRQLGSGPCIHAAVTQSVVRLDDTGEASPWPEFAQAAARLGIASVLCAPLWVHDRQLGTLSLYGLKPYGFDTNDLRICELLGTHAALALAEAQGREQWAAALASRDVIGQAKGILVERHRLTPESAFALLSRASQTSNIRLIDVATHLVASGELLT